MALTLDNNTLNADWLRLTPRDASTEDLQKALGILREQATWFQSARSDQALRIKIKAIEMVLATRKENSK